MKKWVHLLLKQLQELRRRGGRCTRAPQCAVAGRQLLPGGTGPLPLEEEFQDVLFLEPLIVPNSHLGHNWVTFDFFFFFKLVLIYLYFFSVLTYFKLLFCFYCFFE